MILEECNAADATLVYGAVSHRFESAVVYNAGCERRYVTYFSVSCISELSKFPGITLE